MVFLRYAFFKNGEIFPIFRFFFRYLGQFWPIASILHKTVESSTKIRTFSPITLTKWYLADLTAASESPPKCGALGGLMCQLVLLARISSHMWYPDPSKDYYNDLSER